MHGIAALGQPMLLPEFDHFPYVNPQAPKGGTLRLADYGGFDSLNPFIMTGIAPSGIGLTHDSLMKANADEPFSLYGLIADSIDVSADKTQVTFTINPKAKFNDGSDITSADVGFSFDILKQHGLPIYRVYYQDVKKYEIINKHKISFYLRATDNRELPLILGQMPILSKEYWQKKDFSKTTLEIPVSSGPYTIESVEPNRNISYRLNPNYWAKNLNVNKGFYNFDRIVYDTYRDTTVAVEALRSGLIDIRVENEAKKWIKAQEWDLVKQEKIYAQKFRHHLPNGMQGFVFNLGRPLFQDRRVRQALGLVLDFEWINKQLFYGLYDRLTSFFDNSDFKAPPVPSSDEKKLLKPYLSELAPDVLIEHKEFSELSGREALRKAMDLLESAGWHVKDGILQKDGQPFVFSILLNSSAAPTWERVVLPYIGRLKRLGIQVSIKTLDTLSYKSKIDAFDYDMIVVAWGQSLSPGNEQAEYWGSLSADTPGSYNYSGLKNRAVDMLVKKISDAQDEKTLKTAVHALDRVLMSEYIVVPHWGSRWNRYLYWHTLDHPKTIPLLGTDVFTWWKKTN